MTELKIGGVYCDWDPDHAPYINVYLGGEFVIELPPVRDVEASPGDEDAVVAETLVDTLKWALKAGLARKESFTEPEPSWPGLGSH